MQCHKTPIDLMRLSRHIFGYLSAQMTKLLVCIMNLKICCPKPNYLSQTAIYLSTCSLTYIMQASKQPSLTATWIKTRARTYIYLDITSKMPITQLSLIQTSFSPEISRKQFDCKDGFETSAGDLKELGETLTSQISTFSVFVRKYIY